MTTANQRLKQARERAGFETAKDAALSMGVPVSTYIGHENGHRGFPAKRAPQYARKFKVSEEWLLYGKGDMPTTEAAPSTLSMTVLLPSVAALTDMFVSLLAQVEVDPHQDERAQKLARSFRGAFQAAVLHQEDQASEKQKTPAKRHRAGDASHSST